MATAAIIPYRMSSEGALSLSQALGIPLIRKEEMYMRGGRDHIYINWGCGELLPPLPGSLVINHPWAVTSCIDKRFFFRIPGTFPRPPHTEKYEEALSWLRSGKTVVARLLVEGHDGAGLSVFRPGEENALPGAKLYTQFMESDSEWRMHIFRGSSIIEQQRVRRSSYTGPDSPIRVSSNGYGFNIENVPTAVRDAGLKCFEAFQLDFAALDIIFNSRTNKAYVLEINSAPELSPYCVEKYKRYIQTMIINQWGPFTYNGG